VLSLDEKSQIQALDRTQAGLPIKPGRCQTMTHDYKRHGTTTLFAALSVLDGTVIGRCMQHHRHLEFIRFLNAVECQVPAGKPVHAVLDNYATHKHPKVLAWLSRHLRWTFHFTPTCSAANWIGTERRSGWESVLPHREMFPTRQALPHWPPAGPRLLFHFINQCLLMLALWSCGRRPCVVQAQRQIHRALRAALAIAEMIVRTIAEQPALIVPRRIARIDRHGSEYHSVRSFSAPVL
jgi:hypothetical protein